MVGEVTLCCASGRTQMTIEATAKAMMRELVLRPRLPVGKHDKHTPAAIEGANIGLQIGEDVDSNVIRRYHAHRIKLTYFQSTRFFTWVKVRLQMKQVNGKPSATSVGVGGTRAREDSFSARLETNEECEATVGAKDEFPGMELPKAES